MSQQDEYEFPEWTNAMPETRYYARANGSGIWLSQNKDGWITTQDFGEALWFDSEAKAKQAWEELRTKEQEVKGREAPIWSKSPAKIFKAASPESAPASASFFMALCQGRFVGSNGNGGFMLTTRPHEAMIFASSNEAKFAARACLPAKAKKPTLAVLPLRAIFGEPMSVNDCALDPMAGAMAAASAKAPLLAIQNESGPAKSERAKPKRV